MSDNFSLRSNNSPLKFIIAIISSALVISCSMAPEADSVSSCRYARYFEFCISENKDSALVLISPYDGSRDTLNIVRPIDNIIAMSTSYIGFIDAIGCDSIISGVSGVRFVSDPDLRRRLASPINGHILYDVGQDTDPDYETILSIDPEVLITSSYSKVEPPSVKKLRSLGVPVIMLNEYLEGHPLARAEYIRLFGFLTGRMQTADSVFNAVCTNYDKHVVKTSRPKKVLLNVPYGDQWFVPGADNYMSRIISDAGGEVLGAAKGESSSGVMSLEQAYLYFNEADYWLNTGAISSRSQLAGINKAFTDFMPHRIFNNTLRMVPGGGNDFWESGVVHPDLVLQDLVRIFENERGGSSFNYYIEVE